MKRREECSWLACSHRRTALRIKDSRGTEPETWLDSKMFGTNLTFYWLKDWMIKIYDYIRLLCIWRLWLYESCSFQTKLSEVTGRRRRRARAEFEKARRSLFSMQCDLKMMHFFLFLCVFLAMHKFLSWDECGLCMAIDSPWSFTMLQAVQSSSKDTSASHSRLMNEQQRSSRKPHFVESFLLKTRLFRLHSEVCLWNKGWNTVYLVWWPEIRYSTVNQTMTLFSSYETFILFANF